MSIEVRDIFHLYPGAGGMVPALRGLSLSVADGEVCVVRGPNGSGKSTLVEVLSGSLIPLSGHVDVNGMLRVLRQHDNVLTELSVREFLSLAESNVDALMDEWHFESIADTRLHDVSSGTRQLVAAAAVLASRPAVLLADEPAATLSPAAASDLYQRMTQHCREHNVTLILVTHDKAAEAFADRIVRISDGRISEQWLPDQVEQAIVDRHGWLRLPREQKFEVPALVNFEARGDRLEVHGLNHQALDTRTERQASTSSDVAVALRSVDLPFGASESNTQLSYEITQGSLVVVSGPSGVGKSLLLQVIAGIQATASGEVVVTDSCALFADHVGLALTVREAGAGDEWIDRLGLHEFADRPMGTLSGGQRQKSLLAIALSSDAQILLLDDPTSALDEENRELITGILLKETARTIIVASNDELLATSVDFALELS